MIRKLGATVILAEKSPIEAKHLIRNKLSQHGIIKIPNLNLSPKQILKLTQYLIKELILLSPQMAFNNIDPQYKHVCRVGNIRVDGLVMQNSFKNASYWHQDGDYWQEQTIYFIQRLFLIKEAKLYFQTLQKQEKLWKKLFQIYITK